MDNNTKSIDTLTPASYNPRTMSRPDFESLVNSMKKFGDLSGVVKNIETGNLVGGHMRLEAFKKLANPKIIINHRNDDGPNAVGTVANGFIELDNGERFGYREVVWPESKERAANIAANRIQGEFQLDQLTEVNTWLSENAPELLADTGQSLDEINSLLDSAGVVEKPKDDSRLMFKPDPAQAEVIATALFKSRQANSLAPSLEADTEALYLICRDYIDSLDSEVT